MKAKKSAVQILAAARDYLRRGFHVVPIPRGLNHPTIDGWQKLGLTPKDLPKYFAGVAGVGLLLKPSKLTDVDIDCPEALTAAKFFLPKTEMVHGRPGNPASHRFFHVTPHPRNKSFEDPRCDHDRERGMIIEIRGNGQTVVPPSHHSKTGELLEWVSDGQPATVGEGDLSRSVAQVAAAALLARYWPKGSRHKAALALAGMLLRAGWDEQATERFVLAVTSAAQDEETGSRLRDIVSTAQRLANAQTATGGPTLGGIIGEDIANKVREWLQLGGAGAGTKSATGIVKELADAIRSECSFAQDAGEWLYRYTAGVYKPDGEAHVKRRVKALLETRGETNKWSSSRAEEIVEYLRVDSPSLWERPPLDTVNVANGLLETESGELKPHSPEFLSSVQLPVNYDPKAKCPEWEKFVSEVFPKDANALAWEVPAWLMTADISIQTAVLFLGEGCNGKSVFLEAIRAFLGRTNTSAESLHNLESNRFAVAQLVGKLANICPDLPSASLSGSSVFKAITGGDYVMAERKFKTGFMFLPYSRLLFSANYLPRSSDASHAYFRRWLIVPFPRTFGRDEQIPRQILDARLAAPSELSGVLNKALEALAAIRRRNGLCESKSIYQAGREFMRLTDPVAVWFNARIVKKPEAIMTKIALLDAYNGSARRENRPPITRTALGLAVKRLMPEIREGQRNVAGKKRWAWLGIQLNPED
jgi:putative DNA primase/helicase